ncbi:subtilisin family serine protease [Hamadaea flava]|uniref:S8 family serine peptidase n=1 Tax=Hamadaea flava TaxID=1742688 RepID=A0ABV8LPK1_9ACTN|nr:S8 family serine peptidase [Hamadaea flava]MCP2323091.1 subtilisin family serine protease [Hamadaea flava]
MSPRRWRPRAYAVGVLTLGLLLSSGIPGVAVATESAAPTGAAASPVTSSTSGGAKKITLITGDVVTVESGPDGRIKPTVSYVAPRPGGVPTTFLEGRENGAFHVYPSDALKLVGSGLLDARLFDVEYLAKAGYTDDRISGLPLILQYPKSPSIDSRGKQSSPDAASLAAKTDALPGTEAVRGMPSIAAAATRIDRAKSKDLWSSLRSATGVQKVWLDAQATATLDQSVPQIGAPEAWAAGFTGAGVKVAILDTGIDLTHPDLQGKVLASQSFVPGEDVQDGHGHGTHVASTITGSGAASGGKYKGVAPGAQLLIGKVLDNYGGGDYSWIVAGMEWAAANGAKVISMSLGGTDTPGDDPLEQAVADLSQRYGVLFVVAAGNNWYAKTIGTPGSSPAALTVAAVDKQDAMAYFSSRGPAPGELNAKPDISAPGVDIVAAHSSTGEMMGEPGEIYTSASGTSMATPHVAGAVAILAQEHPEWTGQQLKAALTSTAKGIDATALDTGAGRVDVATATKQGVRASGNLDFGAIGAPYTAPVNRTLTYTNDTDTDVSLSLTSTFSMSVSTPAPAGMLTLGRDTVVVPAHGTADVGVTFDVTKPGLDTWYHGVIVATGSGDTVRTAVGGLKAPDRNTLQVRIIPPAGAVDFSPGGFLLSRVDARTDLDIQIPLNGAQTMSAAVYTGKWSVNGTASWRDAAGDVHFLPIAEPEITVDSDKTVTLDLRKATEVTVKTPKTAVVHEMLPGFERVSAGGNVVYLGGNIGAGQHLWSLPSGKATLGSFVQSVQVRMGVPLLTMTASKLTITPYYSAVSPDEVPMIDGKQSLITVVAGHGTAEDLSKVDVRGKLALVNLSDLCTVQACEGDPAERLKGVAAAGATAIMVYLDQLRPIWWYSAFAWVAVPVVTVNAEQGKALEQATRTRPVTVQSTGTLLSPYQYQLKFYQKGRIPGPLHYTVTKRDVAEVNAQFGYDYPKGQWTGYTYAQLSGHQDIPSAWPTRFVLPLHANLTQYFGPVGKDLVWNRTYHRYTTGDSNPPTLKYSNAQYKTTVYPSAGPVAETWGTQPFATGTRVGPKTEPWNGACSVCRAGDAISVVHQLADVEGSNTVTSWVRGENQTQTERLRLFRGDQEIALEKLPDWLLRGYSDPLFRLAPESATYRMTSEYTTDLPAEYQKYARTVNTEWTFTSARPTQTEVNSCNLTLAGYGPCSGVNLLYLRYDGHLDGLNTAKAGSVQRLTITGYHDLGYTNTTPLRKITVELSYDGGRTWRTASTTPTRTGEQVATVRYPQLDQTDGTVSLRVSATDTDGNTIVQTIPAAYGLR